MDINIIISIFALVASIYAIYCTRIDIKKQLRLSKLEEIIEIISFMEGYYRSLFWLFHDTKEINQALKNEVDITLKKANMIEDVKKFSEIVKPEIIIYKVSRLTTLSNAYLPNSNNLKFKVNILALIYFGMYRYIMKEENFADREELSIIPKPREMELFIQNIEGLIIKEMNLGYKIFSKKEHREYFLKHFRNDIEIK